MNPSELAYEAARIMSERGHCKHVQQDEQGRVCLAGALNIARYGTAPVWLMEEDVGRVLDACDRIVGDMNLDGTGGMERLQHWACVNYNNRNDVTGEDVILLLKEAGRRLEGER